MHRLIACLTLVMSLCTCACVPPHQAGNSAHRETDEGKVIFELRSDSVWRVPSRGLHTEVPVVLEITNLEDVPLRFPIMDKFRVSLQSSTGNVLMMEGGQDVLIPGNPISDPVQSGGKLLIDLNGQLGWRPDGRLEFILKDGLGSIWFIGPLTTGEYMLKMIYENLEASGTSDAEVWSGKAEIDAIPIQILN